MPNEDILICKTLLERIDASMERIEERVNHHGIMIAKINTWLLVLGFLAGIVVPSLWAIIFANIVDKPLISTIFKLFIHLFV